MNLLPVIMSGGAGTRLWPVSRSKFPKQFCELLDKPLHTMTLNRLKKYGSSVIVTNKKFQDLTEGDIRKNGFNVEKVLYEPSPRNTAAAIGLVCKYLQIQGKLNQVVGVFSSDNLILDEKAFHEALDVATKTAATTGAVVVLGIKPDHPETGFGYIQVQNRAIGTKQATEVLKFHEKPSLQKANDFLDAGTYFWNAGIFIFKVENMINHFKKLEPEIWNQLESLKPDLSNLNEVYKDIKNISIDYAILEKLTSPELMCVTCDIGWSDLGSWDSLMDKREGLNQSQQNIQVASKNNSVYPVENKTYSFVGVEDLMVVDTADALLICKKNESQKVKDVVDRLKVTNPDLTEEHVFENRPWGKFEILRDQDYYKSKVIRVDAGQKISYQSHAKRAEHWIIVKGEAVVILNDKEVPLKTGEHIFIPQGAKHRIINNSAAAVEFIEVQVGSYFGEDDIVRYSDDYGRN